MVNQTIIVYRNPLEAMIWDAIIPAIPYLAMIALIIIVPIVLWTVIKAFIPKRQNFTPYQFGQYGGLDANKTKSLADL